MEIFIRTDSSLFIGSGHLMRTLTLAGELEERGARVTFVCREHPGNLNRLVSARGFRLHPLPEGRVDSPLGTGWEEDAEETVRALEGKRPDWLVVDHYALDFRWEQKLRPHVGKVMVIDDLANRPHDCDLLLDQNLNREMEKRYATFVPPDCRLLLGPRYALLRPEFLAARRRLRERGGEVRRVLLFFGGVDAGNETGKAIAALSGIAGRSFETDVVVGGANPRREEIRAACLKTPGFHYHSQVENMAELMAAADLAIGAGGSTTWERCSLGLPALVVGVADNQLELAECAAEKGLLFYLGEAHRVSLPYLEQTFRAISSLPSALSMISRNALAAVDGRGALRVAGALAPPPITLRPAGKEDCEPVYRWRNAEETRRYIFDREAIPWESHLAWFHKTLANPERILLIGELAGNPVGVLRYDLQGEQALISVYLVPGGEGRGIGAELIRMGSLWLKERHPGIREVNAEILRVNAASIGAFQQAGYREHHVTYQEVLK